MTLAFIKTAIGSLKSFLTKYQILSSSSSDEVLSPGEPATSNVTFNIDKQYNALNMNFYSGPLRAHMRGVSNIQKLLPKVLPSGLADYSPDIDTIVIDSIQSDLGNHNARQIAGYRSRKFFGIQGADDFKDPMLILRSPFSVSKYHLALDTTRISTLSSETEHYETVFMYMFHKVSRGEFYSNFEVYAFMDSPETEGSNKSRRVVTFKRGKHNYGNPLSFILFVEDRRQKGVPYLVPVLKSSDGATLPELLNMLKFDQMGGPFEPTAAYFGGVNFNTGRLAFHKRNTTQICLYNKFVEQKKVSPQFKDVLRIEFRFQLSDGDRKSAEKFCAYQEAPMPKQGALYKRNQLFLLAALRELALKSISSFTTPEDFFDSSMRVQRMLLDVLRSGFSPFVSADQIYGIDPLWSNSFLAHLGGAYSSSIRAYRLIVVDVLAEKYKFDMTSQMKGVMNSYQNVTSVDWETVDASDPDRVLDSKQPEIVIPGNWIEIPDSGKELH